MITQYLYPAHWTNAVCHTNAIDIHYLRTGGDKPPLLLLHGLTGNGSCWLPVARALESQYDVIMPDARGHGISSAPLYGYTYQDHANDVIDLMRALDIRMPFLLGHGMGGMTAVMVASRLGTAVSGVVMADPTFNSADIHDERGLIEQHQAMLRLGRKELQWQTHLDHPFRSSEMIELLVEARRQTSTTAFDVLIPHHPEFREVIRHVCIPMLLLVGGEGSVSRATASSLSRLNPLLQFKMPTDAGYAMAYDQPERLAGNADSFFRPLFVTA